MGDFRRQLWHLEVRGYEKPIVVDAFVEREDAERVRDYYNAELPTWAQPNESAAYICLCDCENRVCVAVA